MKQLLTFSAVSLAAVIAWSALLARYAPKATARQGETGSPSKLQPAFALAGIPFSETTQAKWDLRRMLAHRAKDI